MTCLGGDHLSQAVSYWKQDLSVCSAVQLEIQTGHHPSAAPRHAHALCVLQGLSWTRTKKQLRPQYEGDTKSVLQIFNFFFSLLSSSRAFLKLTEKQLCVHTSSLESVLFFWVLMLHSFVLHTISTRTFCPPGFISQSIISTPPPSGCITLARMLN